MNQPPYPPYGPPQPYGPNNGPHGGPHAGPQNGPYGQPQQPGISVGGPGGIHIQGANIYIGNNVGGYPQPMQPMQQGMVPVGQQQQSLQARQQQQGGDLVTMMDKQPANASKMLALLGGGALLAGVASSVSFGIVMGIGPVVLSIIAFAISINLRAKAARQQANPTLDADTERRILDVAAANNGRVPVSLAARSLGMTLAEADRALTVLARNGYASIENDPETGAILYVFPEMQR